MSTISNKTIPSWFKWPRPELTTIQRTGYHRSPLYPSGFSLPDGKLSFSEGCIEYDEPLVNGRPFALSFGATHVPRHAWPIGTNYTQKTGLGGLATDEWSVDTSTENRGHRPYGSLLYEYTDETAFLNSFEANFCQFWGGTSYFDPLNPFSHGYFNYDVLIMDGEWWLASTENSSSTGTVVSKLVARFNTWKTNYSFPNKKLGIWAVSNNFTQLSGNLATDTSAYKTGGELSVYASNGVTHLTPSRFCVNNYPHIIYNYVFQSDVAMRIKPTDAKEIWSVWMFEELTEGPNGSWNEGGTIQNSVDVHTYQRPDGGQGYYYERALANPNEFYAMCLMGLFWYDGIWSFDSLFATINKNQVVIDPDDTIGNGTVVYGGFPYLTRYQDALGMLDWEYLARYQAYQFTDILEASGDWIIPEFSLNGGSSWYTGDNRLVPNCEENSLPLIKIKYNSDESQACVLALNPDLNNADAALTQTVHIRDTETGLATSFTLKSIAPYLGRITV